jgi:hypothetical protein
LINDIGCRCLISVDGTDCPIQEPGPVMNPKWYSHKFKGPGVRYEVGICIQTGWIVWLNGPFPCGRYSDVKIARKWLHKELRPMEKYVADGGYRDARLNVACTPTGLNSYDQAQKQLVRSRHETVNGRIKNFSIFKQAFRTELCKHGVCMHAVVNMIQIGIQYCGNELFQIEYDSDSEDE